MYFRGHKALPDICARLGLPAPGEGSRHERMKASFDQVVDEELPNVAKRYLAEFSPSPAVRNALEDTLWAHAPGPSIPKRFRREVARAMSVEDLYGDATRFDALLAVLFVLEDSESLAALFGGVDNQSLRAQIQRHVHHNPGDWDPEELFDRLGAYDCSDRRFCLFLEGLASADVRPDEPEQRRFVALVNGVLRGCGVELRESGSEGGYPIFALASVGEGPAGRPKNLIFASPVKPDLRFRDAINNDIEIVTGADQVLVYDRPISAGGLLWRDLQAWWAEREGLSDPEEAKKSLYRRLLASIPSKLTATDFSVSSILQEPRSRGPRSSRPSPGGVASLGPEDGGRAWGGCTGAIPHGLPAPASPWPTRRHRGGWSTPFRQRGPRKPHEVRGHDGRRS
jgi:hypothetical protein